MQLKKLLDGVGEIQIDTGVQIKNIGYGFAALCGLALVGIVELEKIGGKLLGEKFKARFRTREPDEYQTLAECAEPGVLSISLEK